MIDLSRSHFWIERIHGNEVKHIVIHAHDIKETMDELYVEACKELNCAIPETLAWNGEEWKTLSKWRNTIKFIISSAYTEDEMIQMGLIDDPSLVQLDAKVWGNLDLDEKIWKE